MAREAKSKSRSKREGYTLVVPLDASGVTDAPDDSKVQDVNVVAEDRKGNRYTKTVKLTGGKEAKATFSFSGNPGPLRIAVGPAEATDEEVLGLQTLTADIAARKWGESPTLTIPPLRITPYWWYWWLRWCRVFTIRGKVTCPDGSPVPGAEVCAFDVDSWFIWSSSQQVGCATTEIDGTFEIKFRWCCGWWPWWWWRHRVWRLDDLLVERVTEALRPRPDIRLSRVDPQPSLAVFEDILGDETLRSVRTVKATDIADLPSLRERLLVELPRAPQLECLRLWPWYPWHPWNDCTPDIIFKVTQDCEEPDQVVLEETFADVRWNIPTDLTVNLVVTEDACCVPPCPNPPCDELECIVIDTVCGHSFSNVGGNPGAAPTPVGYLSPGPVPVNTTTYHRAFAGIIPIRKNPNDIAGIDYLEIEVFDDDPMVMDWVGLPAGAALNFHRRFWDFFNTPHNKPALFQFQTISGHEVVETRRHFEDSHPLKWPDEPGPGATTAIWLSTNYSLLLPLDTNKFNDGTYRFRVVGWEEGPGGTLINDRVLPVCGSQQDNEFVLTFDNRVTNGLASHDPAHNCGQGVHLCTTEPDTHISAVRVNGVQVDPCDTVQHTPGAMVEIDFTAIDSDDILGYYVLESSWGLSQSRNLLARPGASVVAAVPGTPTGHAAGQGTGNYGTAVSQGAAPPHWHGGTYTLSIPLLEAFPEPCCYQIELRAYKRIKVGHTNGCYNYWVPVNGNRTEYSIGVGVCPPPMVAGQPFTASVVERATVVEP